ncbi:ATP phosphoribosyltransferase regulatory subunit [Effusibacillus dendaii]|uniref:ATP phosphoribosyltransferase regulatory subunit n=1 Tax=Effusibacillus dendaii TaxID=2743772 RepID=A0A7I8DF59_9BACL|nr:ATP phosphoribosyltransferase regulatory subunit [Effusibacillus dendaii]BCJ87932.1 ATP phosphoribosyltransferase regulatory subunit [Effusibacillus dendaii]
MKKPLLIEKPQGVTDFLPDTAANKRQIEREIAKHFERWGYREIITPTFEYMDTFQLGIRGAEDRVFKFVDRSGRMLVLRPDMTAPIARVAASLLKNSPLPIRLSYTASIFRQQELVAGRDTEFTQAGVELIGDDSPDADAEMISLAVSALKAIGLTGFRLALGQIGFVQGILEEYAVDGDVRERLQNALADKDYVEFERVAGSELDKEAASVLSQLPRLRGGADILQTARQLTNSKRAHEALRNLQQIWNVLEIQGVSEYVQIDLSLLLGLNYYTGAVFEGYAPLIGFPVCGGGRYNELVEKFGRKAPATGFIIGIERVLEILEKQQAFKPIQRYLLCYREKDRQSALPFAAFLRANGQFVSTFLLDEEVPLPQTDGSLTIELRDGTLHADEPSLLRLYAQFQSGEGGGIA